MAALLGAGDGGVAVLFDQIVVEVTAWDWVHVGIPPAVARARRKQVLPKSLLGAAEQRVGPSATEQGGGLWVGRGAEGTTKPPYAHFLRVALPQDYVNLLAGIVADAGRARALF